MRTKKEIQTLLKEKGLHTLINDSIVVIEPTEIANKYNIEVIEMDISSISDNISGFIRYFPETEKYIIVLSSKDHPNRKRFTLAHELGHYFLHPDLLKKEGIYIERNIMFRWWDHSVYEYEANMFAAEYLMPEDQVKEQYKKYGVIEILAWFFNVSNLAMAYRIDNLFKDEQ